MTLRAGVTPGADRDSVPTRDPASFRDPSGLVYRRDGTLYRQINQTSADDWQRLHSSGLYAELVGRG